MTFNMTDFAVYMLALQAGRRPSWLWELMFCGLGLHRIYEYESGRDSYKYCHHCGKTEHVRSAPIMEALRQRPTPLTDDYIRYLMGTYDNDPDRRKMDMYWIETAVAMDAIGAKSISEWDDHFGDEERGAGYKKAHARIGRILFQNGKLSQEEATEFGAFN